LLTCLGVGDGLLSATRGHAAFVYRFGRTQFLVDCGEPAARSLCQGGWQADELEAVFISHLHFDHVGGLLTLLQAQGLAPRLRPLPVYLPRVGIAPVRTLMQAGCMGSLPTPLALSLEALRVGRAIRVGEVRVAARPSTHLEVMCAGASGHERFTEAFSFILEGAGRRVAHSADLGGMDDLAGLVAEPLDLLVCELSHLEPAAVWKVLAGRSIGQVVFVHLSATQWRARRALRSEARRALAPMRVEIPEDGARVVF
jgi:ribonuclease BN (tRNA processing enzyme)